MIKDKSATFQCNVQNNISAEMASQEVYNVSQFAGAFDYILVQKFSSFINIYIFMSSDNC